MSYGSIIASAIGQSTNQETAVTGSFDSSGADLLVAMGAYFTRFSPTMSISDSKGNTWNALTPVQGQVPPNSNNGQIFWCRPSSVGSGHTVTLQDTNSAASRPAVAVLAIAGSAASPQDQQNGASQSFFPSNTGQAGAIVPSQNGCLVVAGVAVENFGGSGPNTFSVDSSFVLLQQLDLTGNGESVALAALVQSSVGSVNPTWTATSGAYPASAVVIASFLPSGALTTGRSYFL